MKDEYNDIDHFISDVMPMEYQKLLNRETRPYKPRSDSAAYKFEEKLEKILAEEEESKTESEKK